MTVKKHKAKVKIEITLDAEFTEDFECKKHYEDEVKVVVGVLHQQIHDYTDTIYSVKLSNQRTKVKVIGKK